MLRRIAALLLLSAPAVPALADADNYVDVYYVPSARISADVDTPNSISGHGYGLKASVPLNSLLLINGEFQQDKYSSGGDSAKIDDYRLGFGFQTPPGPARAAVWAEYAGLHISPSQNAQRDGAGIHARASYAPTPPFALYAEAGYLIVSGADNNGSRSRLNGPEFLFGGSWSFTSRLGVFADYRIWHIDNSDVGKVQLSDFRTGLHINL